MRDSVSDGPAKRRVVDSSGLKVPSRMAKRTSFLQAARRWVEDFPTVCLCAFGGVVDVVA